MIKLMSLITEMKPWELPSSERRKVLTSPEKSYRQGKPMALSFDYVVVEPQVEEMVSTLHTLGIATSQSGGFSDAHPSLGAVPVTAVVFEQGKISPQTLSKIKGFLENKSNNVEVRDGVIKFTYQFPENKRLNNIEAQLPENAKPAILIWREVIDILKQDLPQ